MEPGEREPWVVYLEGGCIGKEIEGGFRVYQVVIRVRGEGLMGVVKVRKGDQYQVAFLGAGSLPGLSAKVRDIILRPGEKFKVDMYPPT